MRIMFLNVAGEVGGAERCLLDVLTSLRERHPDWALALLLGSDGPLAAQAAALGVSVEVLAFPEALSRLGETQIGSSNAGALRLGAALLWAAAPVRHYLGALRRAIAAFAPDVVHTNSLKMHILGSWAHGQSSAVVWHLHDYIGARPVTARLLRWSSGECAEAVANSASVAADAQRTLRDDVRVTPVLNAVDTVRFCPDGPQVDLDALAGLPPAPADTIRVGLLGTFGRWKGHGTLLEAVAALPTHLPVRVYVIGGAVYRTEGSQYSLEELRARAGTLGVADRVGFTGFVADADRALRALDIVVHASTAPEPFGLVIAEAMSCGRAVIASDAGGAREIFTDGVDAVAHAPGNVAELAGAIQRLASDGGLRQRLGRAARQTIVRRFDRRRLADDLTAIYERAVAAA